MNPIITTNRKLEQFFYAHGVEFTTCSRNEDGMTVWTYERTPETEHILAEFRLATERRMKKGA